MKGETKDSGFNISKSYSWVNFVFCYLVWLFKNLKKKKKKIGSTLFVQSTYFLFALLKLPLLQELYKSQYRLGGKTKTDHISEPN